MAKCLACGRENPPQALFCRTCGKDLEEQQKLQEKIRNRQILESQQSSDGQIDGLDGNVGGDARPKHNKKLSILTTIIVCVIAILFLIINITRPIPNETIGGYLYYNVNMDDGTGFNGNPGPGTVVVTGHLDNNGAISQKVKVHLIIETGYGKQEFYEMTDTIPTGGYLQVHWEYHFNNLNPPEVDCSYETLY